ncbi:uncharacterized protein PG998_014842 [Apiospora kogelbergensis]|uniref:uncharacterized protein n=1 Tax=Apiospora kogelbergensis TaxID=1337665 RepID=UPI0031309AD3
MQILKQIAVGAMIGLATAGNGHSPTTFATSLVVRGKAPPSAIVTQTPEGATGTLPPMYSDQCKNVDRDIFVEKAQKFLGYWKKEDAARNTPESEKEILERLVAYQVVHTTMLTVKEENREVFPDDLLDYVRSVGDLSRNDGVLTGANPRALRALDVIFDDICADTGKVEIPDRVQEIVDVMLRGLAINPQLNSPDCQAQKPDCECRTEEGKGLVIRYEWNREAAKWNCRCILLNAHTVPNRDEPAQGPNEQDAKHKRSPNGPQPKGAVVLDHPQNSKDILVAGDDFWPLHSCGRDHNGYSNEQEGGILHEWAHIL